MAIGYITPLSFLENQMRIKIRKTNVNRLNENKD